MKIYEQHKTDLHLHLDGSLPYSCIPRLAELSDVTLSGDLKQLFTVPADCRSLPDYLSHFELPIQLLQTQETLSLACESLVKELYAEHVLTAEIRFAPQFHKRRGLRGEQIVESVIDGMNRGLKACPGMSCGIILCMMIGTPEQENLETIALAARYLHRGVVALDLAGAEGMVPMISFQPFFEKAAAQGIPYTIHAGECGDYHNIDLAMSFGAKRIGHGVAAVYSEDTVTHLVRTKTPIEVCVISNLQTCAIPAGRKHPVKELLDAGVRVTINTDNRTVSGTNLQKEYDLLLQQYDFTEADLLKVQEYGRAAAFPTD